jgi:hypothetical protein
VLPYDDHDRAVKLLHSLDRTIWGGKFEAVTFWNFLRDVSNAKMWISKFRFEIECIIKM